MINDERLKTIADSGNAMQCEICDMARDLITLRAENERLRGMATKLADQAWLQRLRNGNANMSPFAAKMCASEVDKLIAAIVGLTPPTKE